MFDCVGSYKLYIPESVPGTNQYLAKSVKFLPQGYNDLPSKSTHTFKKYGEITKNIPNKLNNETKLW